MRLRLEADWDHGRPMPMGSRLAMIGELFGGLALVVCAVGLAARWSDTIASLLFG